MQTPQLIPYLLQNKDAREIYYKLLSLPLLPAVDIIPQFRVSKVLALARHKTVFADFIKYYENQWIKRVCYLSHFRNIVFFIFMQLQNLLSVHFRKDPKKYQFSTSGREQQLL